ncbi:putative secreted protein [Palleronia aestuarii]|uniref:Putative secreted protein n=1 Tax=Palleronia aestuarii TaxID=568105 RepID=A0A2W7NDL4_9RHOB|nr:VPLPA-CTERM sorting domain-containing protein [Palleronia aestuarii]PZX18248.1 putative secreted protein [Palleronia aestuarii]
MRTKMFASVVGTALAVSAAPALAATLTIDNFDTNQRVTDVPSGSFVNSSEVTGSDILGGARDLSVTNTAFNGDSTDATELRVAGSALSFSNITDARGEGTITYDGVGNAGLGGIDLIIGDNPSFFFEVGDFDREVNITATVMDTMGGTSSYSELLTLGFNPNLGFAEFTGNADFGSIDSIEFFVSSTDTQTAVDGSILSISVQADDMAPIPLPASGLLLLGGLGGLTVLRSRRKKA